MLNMQDPSEPNQGTLPQQASKIRIPTDLYKSNQHKVVYVKKIMTANESKREFILVIRLWRLVSPFSYL